MAGLRKRAGWLTKTTAVAMRAWRRAGAVVGCKADWPPGDRLLPAGLRMTLTEVNFVTAARGEVVAARKARASASASASASGKCFLFNCSSTYFLLYSPLVPYAEVF